ncbi:hypothetical protein GQ44DRAFT_824560 [Phaeosphaeriaceae sp. PMI808]|nr:hypothetical protein GQ44DRAFT_824560 [Phaeosphaeriaceae sp. PMI808]
MPIARNIPAGAHANAQQQPVVSEYDTIKSILTPYQLICNTVVSNHHSGNIVESSTLQGVFATEDDGEEAVWARGAEASPPGTSADIQLAIQKYNHCDTTGFVLIPYLGIALREISAGIGWITSKVYPWIVLTHGNEDVETFRHSAMVIISSTGSVYVADFTLEQFGFGSEQWFWDWDSYVEQVCGGEVPVLQNVILELAVTKAIIDMRGGVTVCDSIIHACDMVRNEFWAMDLNDRLVWLKDRTIQIVYEHDP